MGEQIQDALGIQADQVHQDQVTLVTFLIDDSGSIAAAGNEKAVTDGHNIVIDFDVATLPAATIAHIAPAHLTLSAFSLVGSAL